MAVQRAERPIPGQLTHSKGFKYHLTALGPRWYPGRYPECITTRMKRLQPISARLSGITAPLFARNWPDTKTDSVMVTATGVMSNTMDMSKPAYKYPCYVSFDPSGQVMTVVHKSQKVALTVLCHSAIKGVFDALQNNEAAVPIQGELFELGSQESIVNGKIIENSPSYSASDKNPRETLNVNIKDMSK